MARLFAFTVFAILALCSIASAATVADVADVADTADFADVADVSDSAVSDVRDVLPETDRIDVGVCLEKGELCAGDSDCCSGLKCKNACCTKIFGKKVCSCNKCKN